MKVSVAKAAQRQLAAVAAHAAQLEAQIADDAGILQQLIKARVAHAEADGLALGADISHQWLFQICECQNAQTHKSA